MSRAWWVLGKRLRMGAGLAICAACGSTAVNPTPAGTAAGGAAGGEGASESGGAAGNEDVAEGAGTQNGPMAGEGGASRGGAGAAAGEAQTAGTLALAGTGGAAGSPGATCRPALPVTYRDFNPYGSVGGHDDFEASARGIKNNDGSTFQGWNDIGCGLIASALAQDGKPRVFAGSPDVEQGVSLPGLVGRQRRVVSGPGCFTPSAGDCNIGMCRPWDITPPTYSIKSGSTFDQWFHTVEGVNIEIRSELALTETPPSSGAWSFDSDAFFPLDGAGFGNSPGLSHNYSFTTEAHVKFEYVPGQRLAFRGDDDIWIFVNGKLAIDVGGQHQPLGALLDLDAQAATLGMVPGQIYRLDLFHAERQSPTSTFHLATSIECFEPG